MYAKEDLYINAYLVHRGIVNATRAGYIVYVQTVSKGMRVNIIVYTLFFFIFYSSSSSTAVKVGMEDGFHWS